MRLLRHRTNHLNERRIVWQAASLLLAYPDEEQERRLALIETAIFIALLFVAFGYVWRRGALEWK